LRVPHLQGNHLHKDGKVCQMVAQANGEGQVSISSQTTLIGPHTLLKAETHTHTHTGLIEHYSCWSYSLFILKPYAFTPWSSINGITTELLIKSDLNEIKTIT